MGWETLLIQPRAARAGLASSSPKSLTELGSGRIGLVIGIQTKLFGFVSAMRQCPIFSTKLNELERTSGLGCETDVHDDHESRFQSPDSDSRRIVSCHSRPRFGAKSWAKYNLRSTPKVGPNATSGRHIAHELEPFAIRHSINLLKFMQEHFPNA